VIFHGFHLFGDVQGTVIEPETRLTAKAVLPQAEPSEAETVLALANVVQGAITATFSLSVVIQLLFSGSLNSLFGSIRYLQILVHMLLINVMFPANA